MNKRLLVSAATIVGAAALVGGAAFATFNDVVTTGPAQLRAGTLELGQSPVVSPMTRVDNLVPGDSKEFEVRLRNIGSLDGMLHARVKEIAGAEDGCQVPTPSATRLSGRVEYRSGNTTCADVEWNEGELAKYLTFAMLNERGDWQPLGTVDGFTDATFGPLPAGQARRVTLKVTFVQTRGGDRWSVNSQNEAQGDRADVRFEFALVQGT